MYLSLFCILAHAPQWMWSKNLHQRYRYWQQLWVWFHPCSILGKHSECMGKIFLYLVLFLHFQKRHDLQLLKKLMPYGPTYMIFLPVFTVRFARFSHFFVVVLFCWLCTYSDPTTASFLSFSCRRIATLTILCLCVTKPKEGWSFFP